MAATLGVFGFMAFLIWELSALTMVGRAYRLWGIGNQTRERSLAFSIGASLLLIYAGAITLDLAFNPLVWIFMGFANSVRHLAETGGD